MSGFRQQIVGDHYRLKDAKAALKRQLLLEGELAFLADREPSLHKLILKQMTFKSTTKTLKKEVDYWTRVVAHHNRNRQGKLPI